MLGSRYRFRVRGYSSLSSLRTCFIVTETMFDVFCKLQSKTNKRDDDDNFYRTTLYRPTNAVGYVLSSCLSNRSSQAGIVSTAK